MPEARSALRDFDTLRSTMSGPGALALFDAPWTPIYILVCFMVHPLIGLLALAGGLILGGYEPNPIPWAEDGIPDGFHYALLDADWDHFMPIMELALPRVPALQEAGDDASADGSKEKA